MTEEQLKELRTATNAILDNTRIVEKLLFPYRELINHLSSRPLAEMGVSDKVKLSLLFIKVFEHINSINRM
jgi:hypothetical protein